MAITTRPRSPHRVVEVRPHRTIDRALATVAVAGAALPLLSSAFGLYDRIEHWGKFVHAVDGFCATLMIGLLLLGWRDHVDVDLTDELAGLVTICGGIFFGVMWELVEFIRDWLAYSDLQKSNTDTMTDFLCNDVAAIVAALLAVRLYRRILSGEQRRGLGNIAELLVDGPSRALDRHGVAIGVLAGVAIVAAVAGLWFAGRPVPGIPIP